MRPDRPGGGAGPASSARSTSGCRPAAPTLELSATSSRNVGDRPVELAPWSITQLPLGGRVLLPQRPATAGHFVRPNRTLVLWPYTSWDDPRLRPKDGLLTLDGDAGPDLKLGYFNDARLGRLRARRRAAGAPLRPAARAAASRTSAATSRRTAGRATSSWSSSGRLSASIRVRAPCWSSAGRWQRPIREPALPTCRPRPGSSPRPPEFGGSCSDQAQEKAERHPGHARGEIERDEVGAGPAAGASGSGRAPRHEPGSRTGHARGSRAGGWSWRSAASEAPATQLRSGRVEVTASTAPAALQPRDSAAQDGRTRSTKRPMRPSASSSCSYEVA